MTSGNGDIPLKGSLAMTNRIIKRYKELGGVLHTNKPINKIIISHNKAEVLFLMMTQLFMQTMLFVQLTQQKHLDV